jgi:hypothetical protein
MTQVAIFLNPTASLNQMESFPKQLLLASTSRYIWQDMGKLSIKPNIQRNNRQIKDNKRRKKSREKMQKTGRRSTKDR